MAERKKGRFNIIDGIVVLVIVVIIAGAVYKECKYADGYLSDED